MKLKVLGSNSKGNCYLLQTDNEVLVLEAGLPFSEVKKAINFDIKKIVGVLASHGHGDHSKYIREYINSGITVLALEETFTYNNIDPDGAYKRRILSTFGYMFGSFKVIPFSVAHDVPCVGFVIQHPEMGSLLFYTDTPFCEHTFVGINHILLETNYSDEIIDERMIGDPRKERVKASHQSLATAKEYLKKTDLSEMRNVVLIHLSDSNSDAELFKREIEQVSGKPVTIASKGVVLELSKDIY